MSLFKKIFDKIFVQENDLTEKKLIFPDEYPLNKDGRCPKCGSFSLESRYLPNNGKHLPFILPHGFRLWGYNSFINCGKTEEHLHRNCRSCNYGTRFYRRR